MGHSQLFKTLHLFCLPARGDMQKVEVNVQGEEQKKLDVVGVL